MAADQAVDRSNVADGRVEPDMVVMVDKITNHPLGIFECQWGFGPDGLFFEGAVITFQFAIALWIIGRAQDMGTLPEADKFLEVFGDELRPVVADDSGPGLGIGFPSALDDDLGIGLPHLWANVPGQDAAGSAVEH